MPPGAGRALIDRRLHLSEKPRCADRDAAAGVPAEVEFATYPKLAAEMVTRGARRRGDRRLGHRRRGLRRHTRFRGGLRTRKVGYLLAVACDQQVVTGAGRAL